MSFNIDDPLAGILSNGSDDSFFDDDILDKKKTVKTKQTPIIEKKNAVFDLEQPLESINAKLDDKDAFGAKQGSVHKDLNLGQSKSPTPFKRTISKESIKFQHSEAANKGTEKKDTNKSPAKLKSSSSVDKSNVIDNSSTETKKDFAKSLERGKSSQSILDDILGGTSMKQAVPNPSTRPATAVKKQEFDFESILGTSESKVTTKPNSAEINKTTTKLDNTKDPPKLKKTKSNDDWLGIFHDKGDAIAEEEDDDMPTWLGGGNKKNKNVKETKKETESHDAESSNRAVNIVEEKRIDSNIDDKLNEHINVEQGISSLKLNSNREDLTMEGATLYLQQQESQLMVALQLKAQDEKLAALQLRQKESQRVRRDAALAQHEQIDALLRRQAAQREQMQRVIAAHQGRITQRIKALLGDATNEEEEIRDYSDEPGNVDGKKESPFTKEKNQLLQLVRSLQDNHDKEIDLMETSYRRQLAFLEVSFTQTEERMKEESDKLVKFYAEKIRWLDQHHQLYKKMTEDNLNSMTERHRVESETLRQQHLDNIRVLQEHHAVLMENIKRAVEQEQALVKDAAGLSSALRELLARAAEGGARCGALCARVDELLLASRTDADRNLLTRETQLSEMIQQLKRDREDFEKEKSESKNLLHSLEGRLKQMTAVIEEESASLRQKKMEFEFEKATFSKQTEFAKNVLKKQDEEIKMLREDIQKEYQEKIAKIEEDRAKVTKESALVAADRGSVRGLKSELERTKAELHAQLEEMAREREKTGAEVRELRLEEQRAAAKSRELELLAEAAAEKQSSAEKKRAEAECLLRKYEDRIRRVHEHVVSLNAREKQIAREKVELSRERLSLHNERREIESRPRCSLCRGAEADAARPAGPLAAGPFAAGPFADYTDPKLMLLRLDVQRVISHMERGPGAAGAPGGPA